MYRQFKFLFHKYRDIISYLFFGCCTTLVNMIAYYICSHICLLGTTISTIIAWFLAVVFAYITNKLFVFNSKSFAYKILFKELLSFFGCRLLTGFFDLAIMYICVDHLNWNDLMMKIISNILVIILNYIASKLVIFKKQ